MNLQSLLEMTIAGRAPKAVAGKVLETFLSLYDNARLDRLYESAVYGEKAYQAFLGTLDIDVLAATQGGAGLYRLGVDGEAFAVVRLGDTARSDLSRGPLSGQMRYLDGQALQKLLVGFEGMFSGIRKPSHLGSEVVSLVDFGPEAVLDLERNALRPQERKLLLSFEDKTWASGGAATLYVMEDGRYAWREFEDEGVVRHLNPDTVWTEVKQHIEAETASGQVHLEVRVADGPVRLMLKTSEGEFLMTDFTGPHGGVRGDDARTAFMEAVEGLVHSAMRVPSPVAPPVDMDAHALAGLRR